MEAHPCLIDVYKRQSLAGEGDTVVLFSQGGAGENDIRLDCFFEG